MKKLTQLILLLALGSLWACNQKPVPEVINLPEWKFKTGDSLKLGKTGVQ